MNIVDKGDGAAEEGSKFSELLGISACVVKV